MHKLAQSLPANAVVDYLPASFNPSEDWPMFQLAFCTAQVLGIDGANARCDVRRGVGNG